MTFEYYYGAEAEQFAFLRIPRVLMTAAHFKKLSWEARALYGLMLDRMGLSVKNKWLDDSNRVYIFFTLEDVQEQMDCGHNKAVKLLSDLDTDSGIGLIERVKQGQGRPTRIYVKNFNIQSDKDVLRVGEKVIHKKQEVINNADPGFPKQGIQTSQNRKSRLPETGSADFLKSDTNHIDFNKLDIIDTERQSIHPRADRSGSHETQLRDTKKAIDMIDGYRALIKDKIEYDVLVHRHGVMRADEIVGIMTEAVTATKDYIFVNQERKPAAVVKSCLLKLGLDHVEYVLECVDNNPVKIRNIKSYLLTALYNSLFTIDSHYRAEFNHDKYGDDS